MIRARDLALAGYFSTIAILGLGGSNLWAESVRKSGDELAADYARATLCDAQQRNRLACDEAQLTSVAKRDANEELKTGGQGALGAAVILTMIGVGVGASNRRRP